MEWYDNNNPVDLEESKECLECGKDTSLNEQYCSGFCFEASMR